MGRLTTTQLWIIIVVQFLLFVSILGTVTQCSSNKIDILETNILGYRDSIKQVELKNGELLSSKQSLILTAEAMREELSISKSQIKELEKNLNSKIAQINKLNSQIELKDTVYMTGDTVYLENEITYKKFSWEDKWTRIGAEIKGKTISDSELSIYDLKVKVPLEFGITDSYKVWAKSSNPNVVIEDISSATIYGSNVYPKKKRFHHGIQLGFGINYGIIHGKFDIGPSLAYGLTFSF